MVGPQRAEGYHRSPALGQHIWEYQFQLARLISTVERPVETVVLHPEALPVNATQFSDRTGPRRQGDPRQRDLELGVSSVQRVFSLCASAFSLQRCLPGWIGREI